MERKAGFEDLNGKGGVYLPKLLVDLIGGLFCSPRPYREILCGFNRKLVPGGFIPTILCGVTQARDVLPKYCRVTFCYLGGSKSEGSVGYCTDNDYGVGWGCLGGVGALGGSVGFTCGMAGYITILLRGSHKSGPIFQSRTSVLRVTKYDRKGKPIEEELRKKIPPWTASSTPIAQFYYLRLW